MPSCYSSNSYSPRIARIPGQREARNHERQEKHRQHENGTSQIAGENPHRAAWANKPVNQIGRRSLVRSPSRSPPLDYLKQSSNSFKANLIIRGELLLESVELQSVGWHEVKLDEARRGPTSYRGSDVGFCSCPRLGNRPRRCATAPSSRSF